jgi:hypothetical protein
LALGYTGLFLFFFPPKKGFVHKNNSGVMSQETNPVRAGGLVHSKNPHFFSKFCCLAKKPKKTTKFVQKETTEWNVSGLGRLNT